ncbi:MAG: hypothetical protein KDJ39_16840 [Gammaproteobacteria bacterium]|nr:hypothetical protein [Gammaproteobacteria bacterium]
MNSATDRPTKKIAIVDAGRHPAVTEAVLKAFASRYDLVRCPPAEADYVFHSGMGHDILKCDGIRIFVTGENVTADFNVTDYAFGFDRITFDDRYCRLPLFKLYREAYAALIAPRPDAETILRNKTGFCAYVMSNVSNSAEQRVQIFDALSAYRTVDSGGRWRNNVGGPVEDKIAFQSRYKFALAIENSSTPGYLTEKFAESAFSNAVPIYWGDPFVAETFNRDAFINCHDFDSLETLVRHVADVDQDDQRYLAMLRAPWFAGGIEPALLRDEVFEGFLANIFDQPLARAYRRNRSRWGLKTERRLYDMAFRPCAHLFRRLRERRRRAR